MAGNDQNGGIIAWFANNPVAANLMMFTILIAGFIVSQNIRKQTTPDFEVDIVTVTVPYPARHHRK